MIRKLARIGMNLLMLYTEETYEVPGEPYFGIYRGTLFQRRNPGNGTTTRRFSALSWYLASRRWPICAMR